MRHVSRIGRTWWWLWLPALAGVAVVLISAGSALLDVRLPLLGDLGRHVYALQEYRGVLRDGRVHGWSWGWFGGFPLFYFYFPLPAWLVLGLAELVGEPAAVAAVVLSGPLLLPVATAMLVRSAAGSRRVAAAAGCAAALFLLSRSLPVSGGTLEAGFIGEFSYGLAMPLGLLYLAALARLRRRARWALPGATLLLTLTALSHVLVTAAVVLGSTLFMRDRSTAARVAGTWILAFLLAGWWTIPFLALAPSELGHVDWPPLLRRHWIRLLLEGAPLGVLAIAGLGRSAAVPAEIRDLALLFILLGVAVAVAPLGLVYPGRFMPFALWAAHVLASAAIVAAPHWIGAGAAPARRVLFLLMVAPVLFVVVVREPPWDAARLALRGAAPASDSAAWREAMGALARLPEGAVLPASRRASTAREPLLMNSASMLAPREAGQRSIAGLWQESAPVAQYIVEATSHLRGTWAYSLRDRSEPPDPATGIRQARVLGARYILLAADEPLPAPHGAGVVWRDSTAMLWEIEGHGLALPLTTALHETAEAFPGALETWLDEARTYGIPLPTDSAPAPRGPPEPPLRVRLLRDRVQVGGLEPGVPYQLRLSHFPNWRLSTAGRGPFRGVLDQMVIVPESDTAILEWRAGAPERFGTLASLVGMAAFVGLLWLRRRPPNGSRARTGSGSTDGPHARSAARAVHRPGGGRADDGGRLDGLP